MSSTAASKAPVFERVRRMYNAHPFPNRYSTPLSRTDDRLRTIYEDFLHIPLASLDGKTLLDAGCGTGEYTWFWRRILPPRARVIAVDLSHSSVSIARVRAAGSEQHPIFGVCSLLDMCLPDNSVDVISCSGVLVAVTEPERAYRELVRVLRPGGYISLGLYHRYGRAVQSLRRAVIHLIERDDVDRRSRLGGQLFGASMRRLAAKEQVPMEGALYDQFGLPCESRYSVGQVLKWFRSTNIDYLGTWPPVEWSQFAKALRFSYVFRREHPHAFRLLSHLFQDATIARIHAPRLRDRATMELMWALDQLQLFTISGRMRPYS